MDNKERSLPTNVNRQKFIWTRLTPILPTTFVEGLSFWECLSKVLYKLEEIVTEFNKLIDEWEEYQKNLNAEFEQFKTEILQIIADFQVDFDEWERQFNEWKNQFAEWQTTIPKLISEANEKISEVDEKIAEANEKINEINELNDKITNQFEEWTNQFNYWMGYWGTIQGKIEPTLINNYTTFNPQSNSSLVNNGDRIPIYSTYGAVEAPFEIYGTYGWITRIATNIFTVICFQADSPRIAFSEYVSNVFQGWSYLETRSSDEIIKSYYIDNFLTWNPFTQIDDIVVGYSYSINATPATMNTPWGIGYTPFSGHLFIESSNNFIYICYNFAKLQIAITGGSYDGTTLEVQPWYFIKNTDIDNSYPINNFINWNPFNDIPDTLTNYGYSVNYNSGTVGRPWATTGLGGQGHLFILSNTQWYFIFYDPSQTSIAMGYGNGSSSINWTYLSNQTEKSFYSVNNFAVWNPFDNLPTPVSVKTPYNIVYGSSTTNAPWSSYSGEGLIYPLENATYGRNWYYICHNPDLGELAFAIIDKTVATITWNYLKNNESTTYTINNFMTFDPNILGLENGQSQNVYIPLGTTGAPWTNPAAGQIFKSGSGGVYTIIMFGAIQSDIAINTYTSSWGDWLYPYTYLNTKYEGTITQLESVNQITKNGWIKVNINANDLPPDLYPIGNITQIPMISSNGEDNSTQIFAKTKNVSSISQSLFVRNFTSNEPWKELLLPQFRLDPYGNGYYQSGSGGFQYTLRDIKQSGFYTLSTTDVDLPSGLNWGSEPVIDMIVEAYSERTIYIFYAYLFRRLFIGQLPTGGTNISWNYTTLEPWTGE